MITIDYKCCLLVQLTILLKSAFDSLEGLTVNSEQVENVRNGDHLEHGTKAFSVSFAVAKIRIKPFCSREVEMVEGPIAVVAS